MTGRPLLGLMAAVMVEASHWTRVRWEFDDAVSARVWQFNAIGIALAAVLIWLDGNRFTALPSLLSWLPVLFLPIQFVQSYGMRESLSLNTFSFLARRRQLRNARLGLVEESPVFNFGNVLFIFAMVGASVGSKSSSWLFLPGMTVLTGWMLLSSGRGRLKVIAPLFLIAGLIALVGKFTLEEAEEWIGRGGYGRPGFNPNFSSTMIGTQGVIQQSSEIVWRLQPAPGAKPPRLLRIASFNTYLASNWQNQRANYGEFLDLDTRAINAVPYFLLHEHWIENAPSQLPAFTLRGAANAESPLPLPGDAAALRDFALEAVEKNGFGTVRVFPKHPVIEGRVFWNGGNQPDSAPTLREDLRVPVEEREAVSEMNELLGIRNETPLNEVLDRMRGFFHNEFRYTRRLTIPHPSFRVDTRSAVSRFLTEVRAGHCEYFATAAALMLRDAGIPARYSTGFLLIERDYKRGGYVVRGTHGHAWCRVWDAGTGAWIDFDPTPPNWAGNLTEPITFGQRLADHLKRLREDFFLWRNHPDNRTLITGSMFGIGLVLCVFIAFRLWRSRLQMDAESGLIGYKGPQVRTPLHDLEIRARNCLGERPPGLPFATWLERLHPVLPQNHRLHEAIALHQRIRFDPSPPSDDAPERLAQLAAELGTMLKSVRIKIR